MPESAATNIFLTGFMGAGKSTIGRMLARQIGYRFIDLDQQIVVREGMSIPEIFSKYGEPYFRDCETAVLKAARDASKTIFATGGGIVSRLENRSQMRECGAIVYLRAPWSVLQQRIDRGKGRPLANQDVGWDTVRLLWESRLVWYEEADLIVETDRLRAREVAVEIIARLGLTRISACGK